MAVTSREASTLALGALPLGLAAGEEVVVPGEVREAAAAVALMDTEEVLLGQPTVPVALAEAEVEGLGASPVPVAH